MRPDRVVTRASSTRGDTPRRTMVTSVTGPSRPRRVPRRAAGERRRVGPVVVRRDAVERIRHAHEIGPGGAAAEDVLHVLRAPAGGGEEERGDDRAIVRQHRPPGGDARRAWCGDPRRTRRRRPGCGRRRRGRSWRSASSSRARSCARRRPAPPAPPGASSPQLAGISRGTTPLQVVLEADDVDQVEGARRGHRAQAAAVAPPRLGLPRPPGHPAVGAAGLHAHRAGEDRRRASLRGRARGDRRGASSARRRRRPSGA